MKKLLIGSALAVTFGMTGAQAGPFDGIFSSLVSPEKKTEIKKEEPKKPTEGDLVNKALEGDMVYQKALWAAQERAKAQVAANADKLAKAQALVKAEAAKKAATTKVAETKKPEGKTAVAGIGGGALQDVAKKAVGGALSKALGDSGVGGAVASDVAKKGLDSLFGSFF